MLATLFIVQNYNKKSNSGLHFKVKLNFLMNVISTLLKNTYRMGVSSNVQYIHILCYSI